MTGKDNNFSDVQRAFGAAFAHFKRTTRVDSEANAKIPRCKERVARSVGTGICDTPLDAQGNCPDERRHLS